MRRKRAPTDGNEDSASEGDDLHFENQENGTEQDSGENKDEEDFDTLDVEFVLRTPTEDDFHGIKILLNNVFPGLDQATEPGTLSALVDLVLEQADKMKIGTVIKVEGDEDNNVYGILSVVNLKHYGQRKEVKALLGYLRKNASKASGDERNKALALKQIQEALEGSDGKSPATGLLLQERYINVPPMIAHPFYYTFYEEIDEAVEEGDPYNVKQYLHVCRSYDATEAMALMEEMKGVTEGRSSSKNKGKKKQKQAAANVNDDILDQLPIAWYFPENDLHKSHSTAAVCYHRPKHSNVSDGAGTSTGGEENTAHDVWLLLVEKGKEHGPALQEMEQFANLALNGSA
eukprot:Clim_evm9s128 gene=Clim_evmTU9s128